MEQATTAPRRGRTGRVAWLTALLIVPVLLLTSCKVSDVTDPIVKPIEDLFGLSDHEVATPQFEIVNGITIQVVVRFDDLSAGLPVTVHLRCAGGTEASGTVTLRDSGNISVGDLTFQPGWPAGTDCIVSQDIVHGVETVRTAIDWVSGNDVQATFDNAKA